MLALLVIAFFAGPTIAVLVSMAALSWWIDELSTAKAATNEKRRTRRCCGVCGAHEMLELD